MVYRVICFPSALRAELEDIRSKVSLPESEGSCDTIEQGIAQLTECFNIGGCKFPAIMLPYIRSISKPLNLAMSSERSKLSCPTIDLITALSAGLGSSFKPLISLFIPTLLVLCTRSKTVFTRPANRCLFALIHNTPVQSLLPYLGELDKSASTRLVAAEGILACLNSTSHKPPIIENNTRAHLLEDVIKLTTCDPNVDVRRAGREIFEAYKTLFPKRVARFVTAVSTYETMSHMDHSGSSHH